MDNRSRLRYPGVRPFQTGDQDIFFGRDRDIVDLLDLVQLEKLVVLFSRSGYGKSSLIHAGLIPAINEENENAASPLQPLEIRLSYDENNPNNPFDILLNRLAKESLPTPESAFLDELVPRKTLWYHFKRRQRSGKTRYLLIFDQFEEFFYYPQHQQENFCLQLSELLYKTIPQDVRDRSENCTPEQQRFLTTRCEVKVLFAIRADRLDALDSLKTWLPAILFKRYELKALDDQQARNAITQPAGLYAPDTFLSPPFTYDPDALNKMVSELSGGKKKANAETSGKIESFQLQIVCDFIETKARNGLLLHRDEAGLLRVTTEDLPDFLTVYEDYYKQKILDFSEAQRQAVQLVVEDGLLFINERTGFARRRTRGADELIQEYAHAGVTEHLLLDMERSYVLRREINAMGDINYEISHDTLIAPVLKARKEREAALIETRRQQEQQEAEQRTREAEQRAQKEATRRKEAERMQKVAETAKRKANRMTIGAFALAILALTSTFFAWHNSKEAERQRALAVVEKTKADDNALLASEQTKLAKSALLQADTNLERAKIGEGKALQALHQLEIEKDATEMERIRAEENFRIAQEKKKEAEENALNARLALEKIEQANDKIVDALLTQSAAEIERLNYRGAEDKLFSAIDLGRKPAEVARALLELAYFNNESGRWQQSKAETSMVARLLVQTETAERIEKINDPFIRNALQIEQRKMLPDRFAELEARYYPDMSMALVKGDTYVPKTGIQVSISNFFLARTETTVWQYNLYLQQQNKDILDEKNTMPRPGWGWSGPNPVVYVTWYDAVLYANWLSGQRGLDPVYQIIDATDNLRVEWIQGANGYRLPTEVEWEFAAGGGARQDSFLYAGGNMLSAVGWYAGNANNRAQPIAQKQANKLGLYDMSGNVWEWCWNWFTPNYPLYLLQNQAGPTQGNGRVIRGGAFNQDYFCRIAYRDYQFATVRQDAYGFRLARSIVQ